ncbi:GntR family transcriptional regulator [Umezawaea endophytica]|uniref:GntR family transcriptional regulator n=1 Tax=Umezawaea endophytica TaxID=1654476 RepID=A0A9X2VKD2_9PSEU|nr:GntR family transcriptional regulator [Umezawaea endophytica]MCS7477699.1 GntR family transcriptional regulator [Umezawaea endophytica]
MTAAESEDSFLHSARPKWQWAADRLRQDIAEGSWAPGDQLPVERELANTLSVSINTIRRAVGQLVREQVVLRRQGAGTFVCPEPAPTAPGRRLVGVLVPSTTYYYPRVIDGLQRVLRGAGFGVVLVCSKYDLDVERDELRGMLDTGVQGLVLVPSLHLMDDPQSYVDGLRDLPVPYVLAERRPPSPEPDDPTTFVGADHAGGVCKAVRHLRDLGHQRIGFLGRVNTGTADQVADGFEKATALLEVDVDPRVRSRRLLWQPQEITAYARQCATAGVTAVFCHGDRDAAALVVAVRRLGLSVPGDLAVVAYDDEVAEVGDVPLTAVSPPKTEVGALAAQLLLHRVEGGPNVPSQQVLIQPRLVIRASCGARLAEPALTASA